MGNKGTLVGEAPIAHVDIKQARLLLRMSAETQGGIWKTVEVGMTGDVTGDLDAAFTELYSACRRQLVALYLKTERGKNGNTG